MTDTATLNEDWLRTRSWDVRTAGGTPITTLDVLLAYWGLTSDTPRARARVAHLLTLPAARAMPAQLRTECDAFLAEVKYSIDQPRDEHGRFGSGGTGPAYVLPDKNPLPGLWDRYDSSAPDRYMRTEAMRTAFEQQLGEEKAHEVFTWIGQMHADEHTHEVVAGIVDQYGKPNEGPIYRGDWMGRGSDKAPASYEEQAKELMGETVKMDVSSFSTDPRMAAKFGTWDAAASTAPGSGPYDYNWTDSRVGAVVVYKIEPGDAKTLPVENLNAALSEEHEEITKGNTYTVVSAEAGKATPNPGLPNEPPTDVINVTLRPK